MKAWRWGRRRMGKVGDMGGRDEREGMREDIWGHCSDGVRSCCW